MREDAREHVNGQAERGISNTEEHVRDGELPSEDSISLSALPEGIQMFTAEPITDRKSVFVGRACRISHPSEVGFISYDFCNYLNLGRSR